MEKALDGKNQDYRYTIDGLGHHSLWINKKFCKKFII
jgi:hypothetical protein